MTHQDDAAGTAAVVDSALDRRASADDGCAAASAVGSVGFDVNHVGQPASVGTWTDHRRRRAEKPTHGQHKTRGVGAAQACRCRDDNGYTPAGVDEPIVSVSVFPSSDVIAGAAKAAVAPAGNPRTARIVDAMVAKESGRLALATTLTVPVAPGARVIAAGLSTSVKAASGVRTDRLAASSVATRAFGAVIAASSTSSEVSRDGPSSTTISTLSPSCFSPSLTSSRKT